MSLVSEMIPYAMTGASFVWSAAQAFGPHPATRFEMARTMLRTETQVLSIPHELPADMAELLARIEGQSHAHH